MRFGVLGTGVVGQTIGGRLVELNHDVMMGSRAAGKAARGTEMYLPLWLRLMGAMGTARFNMRIVRA